jgi:AcrR family transcriptional regulator
MAKGKTTVNKKTKTSKPVKPRQAKPAGKAKPAAARKHASTAHKRAAAKTRPAEKTKLAKTKPAKEDTTEGKIKEAARKLFTQHGFAATRTRDIAEEAGINLALLNYYFRSKQKLFDLIMMENFRQFLQAVTVHFQDEHMTMVERVQRIVEAYIDFLTEFPDIPLFILNEIRGNPSKIVAKIHEEAGPARNRFLKQMQDAHKAGKSAMDPFHFIANLIGLTVFPFVGRPVLLRVTGVSEERFDDLMQERKKLVPQWIKMMMEPSDNK